MFLGEFKIDKEALNSWLEQEAILQNKFSIKKYEISLKFFDVTLPQFTLAYRCVNFITI